MKQHVLMILMFVCAFVPQAFSAQPFPDCRLDSEFFIEVSETLQRSLAGYRSLGLPLPVERVEVNNVALVPSTKILSVYIVKDAAIDGVDSKG